MDFNSTFKFLVESFNKENINFAIIGGFAMQAYGIARATSDIDLLVIVDDKDKVKQILLENGYELKHESDDVMNFFGKNLSRGRLDFLIAHRKYTREMLKRAKIKKVLGGRYQIKTLTIEDQIGLKVQSSTNDKTRYNLDLADIEMLIRGNKDNLNLDLIRDYFKIFKREEELDKILENAK